MAGYQPVRCGGLAGLDLDYTGQEKYSISAKLYALAKVFTFEEADPTRYLPGFHLFLSQSL